MSDFFSCLVSFGIRQLGNKKLFEKVIKIATENLDSMLPRSCENFMFFFNNQDQLSASCKTSIAELIDHVDKQELIINGQVRDHLIILSLMQKCQIRNPSILGQIAAVFKYQFLDNEPPMKKEQFINIFTDGYTFI